MLASKVVNNYFKRFASSFFSPLSNASKFLFFIRFFSFRYADFWTFLLQKLKNLPVMVHTFEKVFLSYQASYVIEVRICSLDGLVVRFGRSFAQVHSAHFWTILLEKCDVPLRDCPIYIKSNRAS